jgi:phosphate-selective porin OprO and OprP
MGLDSPNFGPGCRRSGGAACLLLLGGVLAMPAAFGQSIESDLPDGLEHPPRDSGAYALPDLGDELLAKAAIADGKGRYSVKLGLAFLPADYTTFDQDADSVAQVGEQDDEYEVRTWNYVLSYEYKGFDKTTDARWTTTDVSLSTEFEGIGRLSIGKIKEPYAYEMVGDAANLPHAERLLSPFFISRNTGVQLSNTLFGQRATWAIGWYNDWLTSGQSFDRSGNDVAARVTALPLLSESGDHYLHLGASVRYYGGDDDTLRFKGKPASNVASNFVDTGSIPGDHAWNTGLEVLWARDGYSLLGEYVTSSVSSRAAGDPDFSGYYLTAAWVLSGEHRPYDRKAGYARRVQPQGRWGAIELMARYGGVDLNDGNVRGGTMRGWWTGVNWWATRRWKASVSYGDIDLDRNGVTGNTKTWLSRIQWIY